MAGMGRQEYEAARKKGLKVFNSKRFGGQDPYVPVLDVIATKDSVVSEMQLGLMEIPIKKIVGTKTVGRSRSFAENYMPILGMNTEFAMKWINLCNAHLNEGIRDPIKVYEYMNYFYAEEGNKRASVLKYFDALMIPAQVTRLVPRFDPNDETVVIYYEFMEFYKKTGINNIWMSRRNGFNELYKQILKYGWVDSEGDREFQSVYSKFRKIYYELGGDVLKNTTADAFLKYLDIYPYEEGMTNDEIKTQLTKMWKEFTLLEDQEISLEISTESLEKRNVFDGLSGWTAPKKLKIAFVNSKSPKESSWVYGHEIGRNHIENVFGDKVETKAINHVPEDETAYDYIAQMAEEGHDIVFTTSPTFINQTLKAAVEYKNVKFFNCSENMSYKRVRTYFGRIYEPNFLVGMMAGSMTKSNKLGYVVTYPIPEVISSINAFTLGARFVNPHTTVAVKWVADYSNPNEEECYDIDQQLVDLGVDIISHQESSDMNTKLITSGIYLRMEETTTGLTTILPLRFGTGVNSMRRS